MDDTQRIDGSNSRENDDQTFSMQDMFASFQISDVTSTSGGDANLSSLHGQRQQNSRSGDFFTEPMPCNDQDYPFLHKIFQTLFANQDFNNDNASKSKSVLYHLIIKQLDQDGYGQIAHELSNKMADLNDTSIFPQHTLHALFNILFYIEIRSKSDERFSNFLNWFFANNVDSGFFSSQSSLVNNTSNTGSGSMSSIQPFRRIGAAAGGGGSGANLSNPHIYRPLDSSSVIFGTESGGPMSSSLNNASVGEVKQLQVAYKFGQLGTEPGCLDAPHGFCLGINDDIVIADTNNHRICVFAFNGRFKFSFGEYGIEPGKLHQPRKIAMLPPAILRPEDSNNPVFIVCDRGPKRSRMQMFSLDGHYMRLIDMPQMDIVSGLTTTQDRLIIVVDSVRSGLIVMDEFGGLINCFTFSSYAMEASDIVFHNKHFYICDFKGHNICVFDIHGVLVRRLSTKMLQYPNGIDISDAGDIICCDSHGNRFHISVFNEQGQLLRNFECPHLTVSGCFGLRLSTDGFIVTLAKNNNLVVAFNSISVRTTTTAIDVSDSVSNTSHHP
ncbi:hypothetical protein DERF_009078 [Dermatophagoides farinae]|uniref:Cleavage stimulation factor subunit 1 dimerisation domain-containing protein n=1 Tax=Dermatophagoides farinae TaxID=6954 RepID=A0A922HU53_DERFA|nr:hypothetical protein DERF_009078 [Dermatophagoides farinae]